jgi:hypothetical protein
MVPRLRWTATWRSGSSPAVRGTRTVRCAGTRRARTRGGTQRHGAAARHARARGVPGARTRTAPGAGDRPGSRAGLGTRRARGARRGAAADRAEPPHRGRLDRPRDPGHPRVAGPLRRDGEPDGHDPRVRLRRLRVLHALPESAHRAAPAARRRARRARRRHPAAARAGSAAAVRRDHPGGRRDRGRQRGDAAGDQGGLRAPRGPHDGAVLHDAVRGRGARLGDDGAPARRARRQLARGARDGSRASPDRPRRVDPAAAALARPGALRRVGRGCGRRARRAVVPRHPHGPGGPRRHRPDGPAEHVLLRGADLGAHHADRRRHGRRARGRPALLLGVPGDPRLAGHARPRAARPQVLDAARDRHGAHRARLPRARPRACPLRGGRGLDDADGARAGRRDQPLAELHRLALAGHPAHRARLHDGPGLRLSARGPRPDRARRAARRHRLLDPAPGRAARAAGLPGHRRSARLPSPG